MSGAGLLGLRSDPFGAHRFRVEIDDATSPTGSMEAGFAEVGGLRAETETVEYREGGRAETELRFRGQTRFPPLVLRRGLTDDHALWDWYVDVMAGKVERRHGAVSLLGEDGQAVLRWQFTDAYPTVWTGPEFRAGSSGVAFESIELAHAGFTLDTDGPEVAG